MSDVENKIEELKELRNSLMNKSASLDSALLSMDEYLIANLRVQIVKATKKIDASIDELNKFLQIMKNNKKW
jgi:hypothetical protein